MQGMPRIQRTKKTCIFLCSCAEFQNDRSTCTTSASYQKLAEEQQKSHGRSCDGMVWWRHSIQCAWSVCTMGPSCGGKKEVNRFVQGYRHTLTACKHWHTLLLNFSQFKFFFLKHFLRWVSALIKHDISWFSFCKCMPLFQQTKPFNGTSSKNGEQSPLLLAVNIKPETSCLKRLDLVTIKALWTRSRRRHAIVVSQGIYVFCNLPLASKGLLFIVLFTNIQSCNNKELHVFFTFEKVYFYELPFWAKVFMR